MSKLPMLKFLINIIRFQTKSTFAGRWTFDDSWRKGQKVPQNAIENKRCASQDTVGLFGLQDALVSEMNIWDSDMDLANKCEIMVPGKSHYFSFLFLFRERYHWSIKVFKVQFWLMSCNQRSISLDSTWMWQLHNQGSKCAGRWSYLIWFNVERKANRILL